MSENTTRAQARFLAFIRSHIASTGHAPSYDEMKTALGYASKSTVHRVVHALAERGLIRIMPNLARTIQLPDRVSVPLAPDAFLSLAKYSEVEGMSVEHIAAQIIHKFLGMDETRARQP